MLRLILIKNLRHSFNWFLFGFLIILPFIKLKKIIFFSSEHVYGDNQSNYNKTKKISFEPNPKNYYGASKLLAEKYLNYFYQKNKFSVDILRIPRVIDLSNKSLFYKLIKKISLKKKIDITNNNEKFNFIFIDDFLKLLTQTFNYKKKLFRILDLGSRDYKPFNLIDIIKMIDKFMNTKTKITFSNNKTTHNPINLKINYDFSYNSLKENPKVTVKKMIKLIIIKHGF